MSLEIQPTQDEQAALAEAERCGRPFLVLRDGGGRQQIVRLGGDRPLTIGRRADNDVALPWDRQVSRLHAELRPLGGEWVIVDDGLSQNGTYVNEMRLAGRRRLADGDDVRVGRTRLTFREAPVEPGEITPLPGDLASPEMPSEQQRAILRELCRPLAQDGERVAAASERQVAAALGLPLQTVAIELRALYEAFGVAELPDGTARNHVARTALASRIVTFDDLV